MTAKRKTSGPPVIEEGFEDLLGGHVDFFGDGGGGEVFGVDFVLAEFEGDAEVFKEAGAVGLHRVGFPGSNDATRPAWRRRIQSAMGAAASRWWVVMTMVRLLWRKPASRATIWLHAFDIHVGEGLVEEEQLGDGKQGAGERGALAHALGVLAESAGEFGVEAYLAEHLGGGKAGAAGVEAGEVAQVFLGGELVVEHGGVAHVADAGAGVVRVEVAEDLDRAGLGRRRPARMRSRVDLPAPFSPMRT